MIIPVTSIKKLLFYLISIFVIAILSYITLNTHNYYLYILQLALSSVIFIILTLSSDLYKSIENIKINTNINNISIVSILEAYIFYSLNNIEKYYIYILFIVSSLIILSNIVVVGVFNNISPMYILVSLLFIPILSFVLFLVDKGIKQVIITQDILFEDEYIKITNNENIGIILEYEEIGEIEIKKHYICIEDTVLPKNDKILSKLKSYKALKSIEDI